MQDEAHEGEYTIRRGPEGLEISMPVDGHEFAILYVVGLIGWLSLEFSLLCLRLGWMTNAEAIGNFPLDLALIGVTVGGVYLLQTRNMVRGHETLLVRPDLLIIKRGSGNIGSTEEYELSRVKNLRFSIRERNFLDGRGGPGLRDGPVAFDYGAVIVRCAKGVSTAAAHRIIEELTRQRVGTSSDPTTPVS